MYAHLISLSIPPNKGRAVSLGRGKGGDTQMQRPKGHTVNAYLGKAQNQKETGRPLNPWEEKKEMTIQCCY